MTDVLTMKIKVGCCGYSYFSPANYYGKGWKRKYSSTLAAYASKFDLVEMNSTFYRIPKVETAEKWFREAREVNNKFEFTVKCSRIVTHEDRFGKKSFWAYERIREICKKLKTRFLLFQTPASFKPTRENERRMRNFFGSIRRGRIKFVWEPRGAWWKDVGKIRKICEENNVICCVDPLRNDYPWQKIAYFRLHGFGKPMMYNYKFSDEELKVVFEKAKRFRESLILFNNFVMYEDALRFRKMFKIRHKE